MNRLEAKSLVESYGFDVLLLAGVVLMQLSGFMGIMFYGIVIHFLLITYSVAIYDGDTFEEIIDGIIKKNKRRGKIRIYTNRSIEIVLFIAAIVVCIINKHWYLSVITIITLILCIIVVKVVNTEQRERKAKNKQAKVETLGKEQ